MTPDGYKQVPYKDIPIDDELVLRELTAQDVQQLYDLTIANKKYLAKFLPWAVDVTSVSDSLSFIEQTIGRRIKGQEYGFGIFFSDILVGHTSLMHLTDGKTPEIGYWVAKSSAGQGIATKTANALTVFGLSKLGLNKILIRTREDNDASNRIAKKLGYESDGIYTDEDGPHNHWLKK